MKAAWFASPILNRVKKKRNYSFLTPSVWALFILLFFGWITHYELGFFGGTISTGVNEDKSKILCPSGTCYETTVWYNSNLLEAWFDDLPMATDSVKAVRILWAKDLLHKAKHDAPR